MTFDNITLLHGIRIFTLFAIGFLSFTVAGYTSILTVLVDEDVFNSYCSNNDGYECKTQSFILSAMFEAAVSTANISTLFWGSLCLKYNARNIMITSSFICGIFCIVFAFGPNWYKFVSYVGLAFFETGLVFPAFGIPLEYSAKYQGLIFSLLIGGADCSALVFFIVKTIYEEFNVNLSIIFVVLAFMYLILNGGIMFIFSPRLFGKDDINTNDNSIGINDESPLLKESGNIQDNGNDKQLQEDVDVHVDKKEEEEEEEEGDIPLLSMLKDIALRLIGDEVFIVITIWSCFYVNTKYFYIATLEQQLKWITNNNSSQIDTGLYVFDILLPCTCLFTPFSSIITNKIELSTSICLLGIISLIIAIISVIQMYYLQYVTMVLLVFNRFLYFVLTPLTIGRIYGMKEQTTIYGMVLFIAAVYNYTSYLWDYICVAVLNYNFTIINLVLGILCCLSSFYAAYLVNNKLKPETK